MLEKLISCSDCGEQHQPNWPHTCGVESSSSPGCYVWRDSASVITSEILKAMNKLIWKARYSLHIKRHSTCTWRQCWQLAGIELENDAGYLQDRPELIASEVLLTFEQSTDAYWEGMK